MDKDRPSKSKSLDEQIKEAELDRLRSEAEKNRAESKTHRWGNRVFQLIGGLVGGAVVIAWVIGTVIPLTQINNELGEAKLEKARLQQVLLDSSNRVLAVQKAELERQVKNLAAQADSTKAQYQDELTQKEKEAASARKALASQRVKDGRTQKHLQNLESQISKLKQDVQQAEARKQEIKRIAPYLSEEAVAKMLKDKGYFCIEGVIWSNPSGKGIANKFETRAGGKVVYDGATGLTWQQSGSERIGFDDAKSYIEGLNRDKYGGFNDWRLPTLEEAMSLMEPKENEAGLYIDPVFGSTPKWIWTSDKESASRVWIVDLTHGYCPHRHVFTTNYDIRAVRLRQ